MEGEVSYNMTNDYMFRAVLQSNNKVLRGLICSLLHLKETEGREDGKVRSGVRLIARPAPVTGYEWKNASGVLQVEWKTLCRS